MDSRILNNTRLSDPYQEGSVRQWALIGKVYGQLDEIVRVLRRIGSCMKYMDCEFRR